MWFEELTEAQKKFLKVVEEEARRGDPEFWKRAIETFEKWAGPPGKEGFYGCVEALKDKEHITNVEALCAWLHKQAYGKTPREVD